MSQPTIEIARFAVDPIFTPDPCTFKTLEGIHVFTNRDFTATLDQKTRVATIRSAHGDPPKQVHASGSMTLSGFIAMLNATVTQPK